MGVFNSALDPKLQALKLCCEFLHWWDCRQVTFLKTTCEDREAAYSFISVNRLGLRAWRFQFRIWGAREGFRDLGPRTPDCNLKLLNVKTRLSSPETPEAS